MNVTELSLFEGREGPSHAHGPDTERAAARANAPRTGTQRARVLTAIAQAGEQGRTDWELEQQLGLNRPSPGNRRGELVTAGLVVDSGVRRPTGTGCTAVVWQITAEGLRVANELGVS